MVVLCRNFLLIGIFVAFGYPIFAQGTSAKGKFKITNTNADKVAIEFEYYVPYPGLTKVLLFDDAGDMVWRGQYIDKEGDNTLRLRSSYLDQGRGYVFQFEYKLDRVRVPVVGP